MRDGYVLLVFWWALVSTVSLIITSLYCFALKGALKESCGMGKKDCARKIKKKKLDELGQKSDLLGRRLGVFDYAAMRSTGAR